MEKTLENKELSWSIQDVWNKTLLLRQEDWEYAPRNYIKASEIGGAFLDRFYKMKGEKPSNPYDARILRKFEAGNLFEWLVGSVLKKAGLFIQKQGKVKITLDNLLPVYGHYDFLVSQPENWDKAKENIRQMEYPAKIEKIAFELVDYLREKFPLLYGSQNGKLTGMKSIIYEIKSVNSLVFWSRIEQLYRAYSHHRLQLYTYLKGANIEEGRIFYISKDDLSVVETQVLLNDRDLGLYWLDDIKQMTNYYQKDLLPPQEEDLIFNPDKDRWELNWRMRYSSYLSKISGLSKEDWEKQAVSRMGKLNRQIKKEKNGK